MIGFFAHPPNKLRILAARTCIPYDGYPSLALSKDRFGVSSKVASKKDYGASSRVRDSK